MTPGPMDFRGPWAAGVHHGARWLQGGQQRAHGLQRVYDIEKSVCGRPNIFFWRSHENPDKTVAFFPSVLEFTKPVFQPSLLFTCRCLESNQYLCCVLLKRYCSPRL